MWRVVNEGHITNIAVAAKERRRGVGTLLLLNLTAKAREMNMFGLTLEVRIGNEQAQRLYTKFGFKPEGLRKNYYSDTKEDAVIMWKYFKDNYLTLEINALKKEMNNGSAAKADL
jgi:ribosomal-protein-alanine N-acetyltransferase